MEFPPDNAAATSDSDSSCQTLALVDSTAIPCGVQLVNPFRTNRVDSVDLVGLAQEIQKADTFTRANASNKLQVIAEQVRFLQQQARKVLEEAKMNNNLHHVPCNFVKKPGNTYHLYLRSNGQKCFSMLSPQEWGSSCPHKFLGSYRLESDQSWTHESELDTRLADQQMIDKILSCTNTLSIAAGME